MSPFSLNCYNDITVKKRAGEEKMQSEVVNYLPPADATPSTDNDAVVNGKPLPVLMNILDRLTDEHTLAQCVRISLNSNAIVSPSPYCSVKIISKTTVFVTSPRMSNELRQNVVRRTRQETQVGIKQAVWTLSTG